jgi:hypothetical protein
MKIFAKKQKGKEPEQARRLDSCTKLNPVIRHIIRRPVGGIWLDGTIGSFRFQALVFAAHATNAEWELDRTKISKLWIQRVGDDRDAFNWDRGLDLPPIDSETEIILELLKLSLPEVIDTLDWD